MARREQFGRSSEHGAQIIAQLELQLVELEETVAEDETGAGLAAEAAAAKVGTVITEPPAPFHVIARGRAGASLLAMILFEKYGAHQPLNRQSERYSRASAVC